MVLPIGIILHFSRIKMSNHLSALSSTRSQPVASSAKKTFKPQVEASVLPRGESLQQLLTTEDVAALFGIAPATVVWWRSQKQGPTWLRLGRGKRAPIRYRPEVVAAYIQQMEFAEH
jgi:hypothetical protein